MTLRKGLLTVAAAVLACTAAMTVSAAGTVPAGGTAAPARSANAGILRVVAVRDHLPASFLSGDSVYADRRRIFLAGTGQRTPDGSFPGKLFVLRRDRAHLFPLTITRTYDQPIMAVRGDASFIYVGGSDGYLHVYRNDAKLTPVANVDVGTQIGAMAVIGGRIYVAPTAVGVTATRVFFTQANDGDHVQEIVSGKWTLGRRYGDVVEPHTLLAFNRQTGHQVGAVPWGLDVRNQPVEPRIYSDEKVLAATDGAGCCSAGFDSYQPTTLAAYPHNSTLYVNAVSRHGTVLVAGLESGRVETFRLGQADSQSLSTVDLRQLTGHTGPEDIEIRALWVDKCDNLIFAGSSWGDDQSRSELLPSFFVLEVGS